MFLKAALKVFTINAGCDYLLCYEDIENRHSELCAHVSVGVQPLPRCDVFVAANCCEFAKVVTGHITAY